MSDRQDERIVLPPGQLQEFLCQSPRFMHVSKHHLGVRQAGKRGE